MALWLYDLGKVQPQAIKAGLNILVPVGQTQTSLGSVSIMQLIRYGLVVRIAGSHPAGPGSIPGNGRSFGKLLGWGANCLLIAVAPAWLSTLINHPMQLPLKIHVRRGIRILAHRSGLRPERSALDHSAILTCKLLCQHSITMSFITAICLFKACCCEFKRFLSRVTSKVFAVLPLGSFHQCCAPVMIWSGISTFHTVPKSGFRQVANTFYSS